MKDASIRLRPEAAFLLPDTLATAANVVAILWLHFQKAIM
jgi:hypothetical protein